MFALVAAFVLATATPARAGENTFVEVTPNTAQAGTRVSIRASCDNANNQQATVQSDAFGRVVLRPDNGFLTGAVTIPGNKQPGDYPVDLRCANGNTASTTLTVLNMAQPTKGPATGAGGTAGDRGAGSLLLVGGLAVVTVVAGLGMFGSRRRAGTNS
ncbi:hypothetical protein ABZ754_06820 [Micromonospora purpureochromogenes]|uniref:hypothetical protein n=1 Tax=Micromonospora purpureochromogenes TaxID=47872 RepID=UPI0034070D43